MDLSKIFRKGINPTKMGGQAVMEGIMMRGETEERSGSQAPRRDHKGGNRGYKAAEEMDEAAADTRRRRFYRLSYHGDRSVDEVGRAAGGSRR